MASHTGASIFGTISKGSRKAYDWVKKGTDTVKKGTEATRCLFHAHDKFHGLLAKLKSKEMADIKEKLYKELSGIVKNPTTTGMFFMQLAYIAVQLQGEKPPTTDEVITQLKEMAKANPNFDRGELEKIILFFEKELASDEHKQLLKCIDKFAGYMT